MESPRQFYGGNEYTYSGRNTSQNALQGLILFSNNSKLQWGTLSIEQKKVFVSGMAPRPDQC